MAELHGASDRAQERGDPRPLALAGSAAPVATPILNPILALQRVAGNQAVQRQLRDLPARDPFLLGQQHEVGNQAVQRLLLRPTLRRTERAADAPEQLPQANGLRVEGPIGTPTIRRRELPAGQRATAPSDWTTPDREQNQDPWKNANLHNLMVTNGASQYRRIIERRDFYHWFYEHTARLGYATRWALAAAIVANGAYELAHMPMVENLATDVGAVNNELQGMMREGNQVIFNDVFPKLKRLVEGGPIRDPQAALQWDMSILSEEQQLIQPFYARMSPEAFRMLDDAARQGWMARQGARRWGPNANEVEPGPYNRGGVVPGFSGSDLRSIDDRWQYGMGLGNQFSPSGTGYNPSQHGRPAPGADYQSGTALGRVDVRPHLHRLDAELDNIGSRGRGGSPGTMNASVVETTLFQLSSEEQGELMRDSTPDGGRYSSLLNRAVEMGVSRDEIVRFAAGLRIDLPSQLRFLDGAVSPWWRSIDYVQIQPMVRDAPGDRPSLRTSHWRQVFVDVCDNTTIVTAVTDLGFDAATRQAWIAEERSWF